MPTHSYRLALRSLLLTLAFTLALPGSALAQELSPSVSSAPGGPGTADRAEIAAVELPSAPMPAITMPVFPTNSASPAPAAFVPVIEQPKVPAPHRFWDRENYALFATVGGFAAADFCSTRSNLASGGKELNPATRVFASSTPLLATNFALETASVMGVSYLFHKTGHHKLERLTSFVDISASATAVGYSMAHR